MLFLIETTEKLRILTFCLRDVQFIDCAKDFDWACDRQTARLCSLTRDNLKQTNKIENFRTVLVFADNHQSNYTKTIIRLRVSKYW